MAGEVSFTPSEADYIAANRDWFRHILRRRRMVNVALATGAVTGLIGGLAAWLEDPPEDVLPTAIGFAFLGFAMLALILGASWLRQPQRSRRLYRQQKFLHRPWRCAWSDDALESPRASARRNSLGRSPSLERRPAHLPVHDERTELLFHSLESAEPRTGRGSAFACIEIGSATPVRLLVATGRRA